MAAGGFECLKVYDLRHKIANKKYQRLIRSRLFWTAVIGMLAASGFFAWGVYAGRPDASAAQLAIAGIAARSLIRDGLSAITAKQPVKLGGGDEQAISTRDLFR